ncbi:MULTISPECIES: alanine racemase [unclassified Mycobacterium]|uniref:alanine racemase n=1 Tax=Mycolicibacterium cosmeticum TaxID=258533 RepID=UPI000401DDF6
MESVPIGQSNAEMVIDLDAIDRNVRTLCQVAGDAAVMAVVKADGYNHGATRIAATAVAAGAREIGVATLSEALELRDSGIEAPIMFWLSGPGDDFAAAIARDCEIAVTSERHLDAVCAAARSAGRPATISIKVDTGLNRNGFCPRDYRALLTRIRCVKDAGLIRVRGIFSHLACADDPNCSITETQRSRFLNALETASAHGITPEVTHIANSAAALTRPDLHFQMVRAGIALYGLSPVATAAQLVPAMTLQARVVLVKDIAAGEGVSYGHMWTALHDTTIALIPIGYADGLPRALSGKFSVLIGHKRYPSVGRICMDQVVVDVGQHSGVREGDVAVLFGNGRHGESRAQDWAETLDTIHYEIVTGPRGRVRRRFIGGASTTTAGQAQNA